jgi:hypothetical protein
MKKKRLGKPEGLGEPAVILRHEAQLPLALDSKLIFLTSHDTFSLRDYKVLRSQKTPRVVTVVRRK